MKPGATTKPRASITCRPCRAPLLTAGNLATPDAEGAHRVESRLRVDDSAVLDHDVIGACLGVHEGRAQEGCGDARDQPATL